MTNAHFSGNDVYSADIYTEPDTDVHTLANLGPLRDLAGVMEGDWRRRQSERRRDGLQSLR